MIFVEKVRETYTGRDKDLIRAAVSKAIDYCIDNSILEEFFRNNRLLIEENEMLDFTYERRLELATRDAKEEGMKLGISQGISEKTIQVYKNCIARGMTKEESIAISGISEEDISLCSETSSI